MGTRWIALVVVAACTDPSNPAMPDAPPPTTCERSGTLHGQSTVVDGETRYYWLHVPASYRCEAAMPLLVDFHGTAGGAAPEEAYQTDALIAFSEAHGVIVARPR